MSKRKRREFTEDFKREVVAELQGATAAGVTRRSILDKHGLADSLTRLWERNLTGSGPVTSSTVQTRQPLNESTLILVSGTREQRFSSQEDALLAYIGAKVNGTDPVLYKLTRLDVQWQASIKDASPVAAREVTPATEASQEVSEAPSEAEAVMEAVESEAASQSDEQPKATKKRKKAG
jgi:transposase-like protein